MDLSKFLAKVLGPYLIIVSVLILLQGNFTARLEHLLSNADLLFVTGFFTLILGLLMVVAHNHWQKDWTLIITIISWLTLLKGLSLLVYPEHLIRISQYFIYNKVALYLSAGLDIILGLILSYEGYSSRRYFSKSYFSRRRF